MRKVISGMAIVWSVVHSLSAQQADTVYLTLIRYDRMPVRSVKLSLSEWMTKYPSVTGAYEHKIGDRWSLGHQLGVIINAHHNSYERSLFRKKKGFKVSTKIRRYRSSFRKHTRVFIEGELYYQRAKFDRTRVFRIECGRDCLFSQSVDYETVHDEAGFRLRPGWMLDITGAIFLEVDLGLGVRYYDYTSRGRPAGIAWDFFANPDDEYAWSVSGDFSFKLGLRIK